MAAHGFLKMDFRWCAREMKFLVKGIKLEK